MTETVERPAGSVGGVVYAYTFVFFTGTVLYTLVEDTRDWTELTVQLGTWLDVHSVLMVVAGVAFGVAVVRAGVCHGGRDGRSSPGWC